MRNFLKSAMVLAALAGGAGGAQAGPNEDCLRNQIPQIRVSICSEVIASKQVEGIALARIYRSRASAFAEMRKTKDAIADYTAAIRLNRDYALAFAGRGHVKLSIKDLDGAILDYDKALILNGRLGSVFVARGYAYQVKGKTDKAVSDYSDAIRVTPKNATAYNNRGLVYRSKGKLDEAIADYTSAIQINPLYALAYNNRGYANEAKGRKKQAMDDFRQALLIDPSLAGARKGLVRLGAAKTMGEETRALLTQGKALVQKNCAWCHAVERRGASPNKKAPPFRDIHKRHPILTLREPLSRGIAYPHDAMPKFVLSDSEIDMIVAYINHLSSGK